jgi:hypothetical protein
MFTYCLVTKGRRDYLPSTLESLSAALEFADVNVIIIDNGCPTDVSELLMQWCAKIGDRTRYLRFEVNETSATRVWKALRSLDIDWVSFPGDDDLIQPRFLEKLRIEIERNRNLTAVAASMKVIDSAGIPTGEVRSPREFTGSIPAYFAHSIGEPPFLFPALFFKFSIVKGEIPTSRYVFDWWLALNLVAAGGILTSNEIAIDYRVHPGQESALAPKRRKFFEAQIVFSRFFQSSTFKNFISSWNKEEIREFWLEVRRCRPIYQDHEFGNYLFTLIGITLADSMTDTFLALEILSDLAIDNGVLLRHGEVSSVSNTVLHDDVDVFANFQLEPAGLECQKLMDLITSFNSNVNPAKSFVVGCIHSHKEGTFRINCEEQIDSSVWVDSLIVKITETLESQGKLSFTVSPAERMLISSVRRLKSKLPNSLIVNVKRFVSRTGRLR